MADFSVQKEQSFVKPEEQSVFAPDPMGALSVFPPAEEVSISSNAAANRALDEQYVGIGGGEKDFELRYPHYSKKGLRVMDAATEIVMQANSESMVRSIMEDDEIPLESKIDYIRWEIDRTPYKNLTPYDLIVFQAMRVDGGGMLPIDNLNRIYQETSMSDLQALGAITRERQLAKGNRIVNEVAAAHGWKNFGDMAAEVAIQDFIPIWNVATRLGLANIMADVADVELSFTERLLPGSIRARMREHLVSLEPEEFSRTIREIGDALLDAQAHPVLGPIITDYNAMEFWTTVFNDEVMRQGNPQDNLDLWLGNAELGFEALFGAMVLGKIGGKAVVRTAFSAADSVKARQAAVTVRNSEQTQALTEMLPEEVLASKFQIEASSEPLLPKPAPLADDIEYLPDGSRPTVDWARSEALDTAGAPRAGRFLSEEEKLKVLQRELKEIDEFDGPATMTRMSTIEILDDDAGFRIKAVFGETPNKGFSSFEDAAIEMLELDPQMRKLEIVRVSDRGTLEPVEFTPKQLEEFVLGEGAIPATRTGEIIGDEYFIRYTQERAYHPFDKTHFGSGTLAQSVFRWAFSPNAKFSSDFYNQFADATFDEERTVALLGTIAQPYRALGVADKIAVDHLFEWSEEFGKLNRRAPEINEIRAKFPDYTPKQLEGYQSLQITYDTMYEMLNRRQYNEWFGAGFKTARPVDNSMATYHGKPLLEDSVGSGSFLDPVTGRQVQLSKRDIQELYANGATVLELDVPVATVNARTKVTRVILDPEAYRIGDLSHNPLKYHPGYHFRFYDDPYYVIKRETITVDGKKKVQETAIRTAGSRREADKWAARANRALTKRYGAANAAEFEPVRARDIDQAESSLLQKEVFQREGRLFYDDRNFDALPSVNGNRAPLEDQATALEMGIRGVAREIAGKDSLRTAKRAWQTQYSKEFGDSFTGIQKGLSLDQVEDELVRLRRNTPAGDKKNTINDALQYIRYFRLIEGTNNAITPVVREGLIHFAEAAEAFFKGKGQPVWRGFQKWAQISDPLKTMRSVAFTLFMRMRPIRQFIMQSAQPVFLMGIDPKYISSGRWALDAQLMQLGVGALRGTGELPLSVAARAKAMGLSQAQYRKLIKEFERSGLLDTVDAHDYTGGQISLASDRAVATPNPGNPAAIALYGGRKAKNAVLDALGTGFNKGESNNLAVSYMVGLRKYMKENDIDDLLKLNASDWRKIRTESSNLALAMIKPNSMRYQTGLLSLATQFLSFQHKSALAILGLNPSITPKQAARLWAANAMLYGADFVGYGMLASTILRDSDLEWAENEIVPGTGRTFRDILAEGFVENVFNELGENGFNTWQDLDLKFLAPGPDVKGFFEDTIRAAYQTPGRAFFGPFGSIYGNITQQLSYAQAANEGLSDLPAIERYGIIAKAVLDGSIPQLSDIQKAELMRQHNLLFTKAGEPLDLVPTQNAIYARLIGGIPTNQETAYYTMQGLDYENEAEFRDLVRTTSQHLNKMILLHYDNKITAETMDLAMRLTFGMWDDIPEGRRVEFRERVFNSIGEDGTSLMQKMVERASQGQYDPAIVTALEELENVRHAKPGDTRKMIHMYEEVHNRRTQQEQIVKERIQ